MRPTAASALVLAVLAAGCDSKKATPDASAKATAADPASDLKKDRALLVPAAFEGLRSAR